METHDKLWGKEHWIVNNDKYCGKILILNKGYQCSYHYHKIKHETFYILKGAVQMELNGKTFAMVPGDSCEVKPGYIHRFTGFEYSEIMEFSTKHFESDSYRIEESRKVII